MSKLYTIILTLALSTSIAQAQSVVALSWNSTSPFGQSVGSFGLVQGTYGFAMTASDGGSNITAIFTESLIGFVAALIPQSGVNPATYVIEWVDVTTPLPEGSSTSSLVPAPGGFVSTLGTGIFKEVQVNSIPVFAWVEETAEENGDVEFWIDSTDDADSTCA
ncbi:hypothetical protein BDP27DRAFT_1366344 [Rhodocollybia butyracea]|uniref:PEP-CTERM sorting domain-containing protein n=1 Tax=Rhodocollybia butyracea TaxID=206335 RepID=A0A9P5PPB8_9AGAR|nr:hypothetical protein BDP27DRAFT_1366344 [Rhodocollybia butyracea]